MLSSCYFKTLLFIVGPAWWEFMAAQVATFPSVPSSDSTSSHTLWRLLADPKPWNPGSLRIPVSQYPMASCTTGQKYILLDLTQDLALFNIHLILIDLFDGSFNKCSVTNCRIQSMVLSAKGQTKMKMWLLSSKNPGFSLHLALRLGPEVAPDRCSGTLEFSLVLWEVKLHTLTLKLCLLTSWYLGKSHAKVLAAESSPFPPASVGEPAWDLQESQRLLWISNSLTGLWNPCGHPRFLHKSNSRELFSPCWPAGWSFTQPSTKLVNKIHN